MLLRNNTIHFSIEEITLADLPARRAPLADVSELATTALYEAMILREMCSQPTDNEYLADCLTRRGEQLVQFAGCLSLLADISNVGRNWGLN